MRAYAQGQELSAQGKFEEALVLYEEAVESDPEFGRAYAGMGVVYGNGGQAHPVVQGVGPFVLAARSSGSVAGGVIHFDGDQVLQLTEVLVFDSAPVWMGEE